ncbi:3'(2'),5'-bisphosphate nucleotidase CysQ [Kushneria indalinina]|uniref:3'(2'),5'-bisphosphate nucleotidase CysQ n=1 Tax=Kushneria indalinina DSM 14324 TaxID=1122140 RepID=A0A3D9E1G1_9GAMM|nr:3'(2'),5'-bisphosphate nucleotidase CysQ [Kushneria indalinina]REC96369.1 3'(2'),5'-bisphosphate nucleotidase [Kushneria indalinina DSM 14324]
MTELLESVKNIAWDACGAIMSIYQDSIEVTAKSDSSPLTQADLAAHRLIVERLSSLAPSWPTLSEESDADEIRNRLSWSIFWLIDPLDGTKEFINRNGEFTVNIALVHEGKPILGVIAAPVLNTMWYGAKDNGAWRQRAGEAAEPIATTAWKPDQVLRVVGSRSHGSDEFERLLKALPPYHLQGVGSSLKFCRIAEGAADCYPRPGSTCEWDTGAAHIILEEAGGAVLQLNTRTLQVEEALQYNQRQSLINPDFIALGAGLAEQWNLPTFLKGANDEST